MTKEQEKRLKNTILLLYRSAISGLTRLSKEVGNVDKAERFDELGEETGELYIKVKKIMRGGDKDGEEEKEPRGH